MPFDRPSLAPNRLAGMASPILNVSVELWFTRPSLPHGFAGGQTTAEDIFFDGRRPTFIRYSGARQIYPLAPGEHFISDEWFLLIHEGDWHKTAEAYRCLYEETFEGDFLTWEETSPAVRDCDIVFDSQIARPEPSKKKGQMYDLADGEVVNRFSDLPSLVGEAIGKLSLEPRNAILIVLGTGPNWGWGIPWGPLKFLIF